MVVGHIEETSDFEDELTRFGEEGKEQEESENDHEDSEIEDEAESDVH